MKHIYLLIIVTCWMLVHAGSVHAMESTEAGMSARPSYAVVQPDKRVLQLRMYLESHNSPLTPSAEHFVSEADRLGLDWRLVAAIAGVESTFGKHVPRNSFNGWGWGIVTGARDGIHFASWNDGISTVSEGLRYRYVDKGAVTIEQMGRRYAASPVWSHKVKYFLGKIDSFAPKRSTDLAVTI